MRILYLTNIPSPYRVDYFNELGKNCELTVLFELKDSTERNDSWKNYSFKNFEGIFLSGKRIRTDAAICPNVIKYLKKNMYDEIIVTNMSSPTGILAISLMKLKGLQYSIEGDGGFAGDGDGIKEKLKKWMISGAKECFSTSKIHDKYYLHYGAKENAIFRYPFSSMRKSEILDYYISKGKKQGIRQKLSISEDKVILAIGQFIPRKGFDLLIKANEKTSRSWGLYIIGGRPTEEYIDLVNKQDAKNIHFLDFMPKEQLQQFFLAADIFVLPTREDIWGLVINEAVAMGLPVITTNRCIAGTELVEEGKNGYLVEADNFDALADAINRMESVVNNDEQYVEFARNSIDIARKYTIEEMAKSHITHWSNESSQVFVGR